MIAQWGSREGGSLGEISRRKWWVASWISPGRALHAYRTVWKIFYGTEQHSCGWEAQVWCARSLIPETDTVWARENVWPFGTSGTPNVGLHWVSLATNPLWLPVSTGTVRRWDGKDWRRGGYREGKKRQGEGKETKGRNVGDIFECGLLFEFLSVFAIY